jgi:ATP-dependent DNA helicase RecQ
LNRNLLELLRRGLGNSQATFHVGQEEAIRAVIEPPHRALVVQATGWGKSMVYFLATKVLRDQGKGPTLVVSPLLSLMRNQVTAAVNLGLKAGHYTSANPESWEDIQKRLLANEIDLLLISPERLANEEFQSFVASSSLARVGLLVIDEAHCISDWGHDFRPDYQRLGRLIRNLPTTTSVLATTATANDRVVEDVLEQIGKNVRLIRGSLARKSLRSCCRTRFSCHCSNVFTV